ncbi:ATP-dependent zinc protease family protein [Marinimicrobium locisalis]|uniref:ATP-dependent zinc protease family protein n=1 Tax=Marinimicrobium locisalis TaxID=546022 RepID=UPI0032218EAC
MNKQDKSVIGWREWVRLPALGQAVIKAKIDTGARTSALHAYFVEPFELEGRTWVRFGLHPRQKDTEMQIECEAPVIDQRRVTDSGGHVEMRYVIATTLVLGGEAYEAEVTLTDRENMLFRMLLGRGALKPRFLVDSDESFVLGGDKYQPPGESS